MGLFKNYVSQTRKPEGLLGKIMLDGMNSGHAVMADWGLGHLPPLAPKNARRTFRLRARAVRHEKHKSY